MSTKKKVSVGLKIILAVVLLVSTSIVVYIFLNSREDNSINTHQQRTSDIKKDLITLIPEQYEVIESEYEQPNEANYGCIPLYEIYPEEYTDIEREYLNKGSLIYCEDINKATLKSQMGEVSYSKEEERWLYIDGETRIPQEEMTFGTRVVTFSEPFGSHNSWKAYIVRLGDTGELIILYIPSSNRIRCEVYDENGVESLDEECINFRDSLSTVNIDWVSEEVYEEYFNDLLEILENI